MMSHMEAMQTKRRNLHSVWSPLRADEKTATGYASDRIYDDFAEIWYEPKFRFSKGQGVFCVGSCFARELEDALIKEGLNSPTKLLSDEMISGNPELFAPAANVRGRPSAFLNRYNSGSMLLLIDDILKNSLNDKILYGPEEAKADFHYTRFLDLITREAALCRRSMVRSMYLEAMEKSQIFVFTLGLCEAFFDDEDDLYLNIAPDRRIAAGRAVSFRFLSEEEVYAHLVKLVELLQSFKPEADIVFTVSPVPLNATFTEMDIVVANTLAKSRLLSAAHRICRSKERCHYFPSFEIVTNSSRKAAWRDDKKHVSPEMVSHIMKRFINNHLS